MYDAAGRLVFAQKEHYTAGWHEEMLHLEGASGMLLAELVAEEGRVVRKMLAVKN